MPAVHNQHKHSIRDLRLRLLCDAHSVRKVHTLGTIRSTVTSSNEWHMLFSDTKIYCYKLIVTGRKKRTGIVARNKQILCMYMFHQSALKSLSF
jgi:hypothetical protein